MERYALSNISFFIVVIVMIVLLYIILYCISFFIVSFLWFIVNLSPSLTCHSVFVYQTRERVYYETRTATPARTSSGIPQSKSCFHTLLLIYHPEGHNKAPYNSEMPENDILTLKTNI